MANTIESDGVEFEAQEANPVKPGLFAAGGILGAIGASACCILPLTLTLFGVSGAWMSNLRALTPYQPYFMAMTVVMIGFGFYQVYWKPRQVCAAGDACARPLPNRLVKSGLWTGTILVLAAATFPYWFGIIEPYLP
jgi:mercuric ion transport protein